MTTTPTHNAVPSESPRDLKFNAGKIDEFVTSRNLSYLDRFGGEHYTIDGLKSLALQQIYNLGWNLVGSFQAGATLNAAGDIIQDTSTGLWYRWDNLATLPKVVPAGSTPASTGGVGVGAWQPVEVTDVLRKDLASYLSTKGSSLVSFAGFGEQPGTVKSKLEEFIDLADYAPGRTLDASNTLAGATANTDTMNRATAAAALLGKAVRAPSGTFLFLPFSLPTALKGFVGRGKYATTIKFFRQSYSDGSILLNAQNNTGIEMGDFTIDCDDPVFLVQYLAVLPITGTNNSVLRNIRIVGRGDSAIVTLNSKNLRIDNYTCDATGSTGTTDVNKTFGAAFYGTNCENVIVTKMRTTGYPRYSGQMGVSSHSVFSECYSGGTSGGFGYGFGLSSHCSLISCSTKNTSHEAYQFTECFSCVMALNHAEWEGFNGQDAGMSISGGATNSSRMCVAIANTFVNSYAAGLMVAGNTQYNVVAFNTVKDCATRGTAAGGAGTNGCAIGMYTDLANQQCIGNKFIENTILTEASPGTYYGYAEFNNGSGATIAGTQLRFNQFAGTILTARYLAPSAKRNIWDTDSVTFTPTITSQGGTLSGVAVQSASYHLDGPYADLSLEFTITNAGTGTGSINVSYSPAPTAETNHGTIIGREVNGINNKMLIGLTSGSSVGLVSADGTTVIATGARYAVSGRYKIAA